MQVANLGAAPASVSDPRHSEITEANEELIRKQWDKAFEDKGPKAAYDTLVRRAQIMARRAAGISGRKVLTFQDANLINSFIATIKIGEEMFGERYPDYQPTREQSKAYANHMATFSDAVEIVGKKKPTMKYVTSLGGERGGKKGGIGAGTLAVLGIGGLAAWLALRG